MSDMVRAQEAWAKSISTATAWIPGMACTSQTMVTFSFLLIFFFERMYCQVACICYSIIIGDLSNDLMKSLGVSVLLTPFRCLTPRLSQVRGWAAERNNLLAAISAVSSRFCWYPC